MRKNDTCTLKTKYIATNKQWFVVGAKGGVCKACKLFANYAGGISGYFTSKPWTDYSRAKELERHAGTDYHRSAIQSMYAFVGTMVDQTQAPIDQQLDSGKRVSNAITINRLHSIIQAIVFCARQGIPLRGHRHESDAFLDRDGLPDDVIPGDVNRGNFLQLLDHRWQAGDTNVVKSVHLRAKYTSPAIQNELIDLIGQHITCQVVEAADRSTAFSLIADETRDVSNVEQLCVAIRYYNRIARQSEEKFIAFVPVESLRGIYTYNIIHLGLLYLIELYVIM